MAACQYDLPAVQRGDTFLGISVTVQLDDNPMDLTGAGLAMDIRQVTRNGPLVKRLTSPFQIVITDAMAGEFSVLPFSTDGFPVGDLPYDIEVTLSNGHVHTVVIGVMEIIQDVTR